MMSGIVEGLRRFAECPDDAWADMQAAVGLPQNASRNAEGTLALEHGFALFEALARWKRDPSLALRFAQELEVGGTGPLDFAMVSASTVEDALQTMTRFMRLIASLRFNRYERTEERGSIVWQYPCHPDTPRFQYLTFAIAVAMERVSAALPSGWRPPVVDLDIDPPHVSALHEEYFGRALRFRRSVNVVSVQAEYLHLSMPEANPRLFAMMTRLAEIDRKVVEANDSDTEAQARRAVAKLMKEGRASVTELAGELGLSASALRTKLGQHGLEARQLIDDVRRDTAKGYLLESNLSMTEIAFALGFSDSSSFTRACRKWFGKSPSEIRGR